MKITGITGVTIVTVLNKKWHLEDHGWMFEVHISMHSSFRLKITVGCLVCMWVVWCECCCVCVCMWRVWCVGCVCTCGVVSVVVCVCMWRVWCVGCVCTCGVVCTVLLWWCVVKLGTLSLLLSLLPLLFPFLFLSSFSFFFFSCSFSYSCSCSCSFSFSSLLFSSLSSLLATKHYGKNRSTNTAANIEAFECDVAHGTFIATANELHGMFPPLLLPPLLSSLLPPSHTQKKERCLFITGIFPAMN